MQLERDVPPRGARYFSQPKTAEGDLQTCQKNCVTEGGDAIQRCVWDCETQVNTQPAQQLAPLNQAAFNELVLNKRIATDIPNYHVDFTVAGRFQETEGSNVWSGTYTYVNTGTDTGTLTLNYNDGDRCTSSLTFASATAGTVSFQCDDGSSGSTNWRLMDIP